MFVKNAWYCGAWSSEITRTPFARKLLNEAVLFYRTEAGSVAAIGDVCPHRFAPLHKGQLLGDLIACPYHGLQFDPTGACVHNPHGTQRIPPRAKVRSYPVLEREGTVWIWMGKPDAAREDLIQPLHLLPEAADRAVRGHILMGLDYRLVFDNLLDLTHAPYLHAGSLSPKGGTRETEYDVTDCSVISRYKMRAVETPGSQRPFYNKPIGDYHTHIEWIAPSVARQKICMVEVDQAPWQDYMTAGGHLITPETETSTHYFWYSTRNRLIENQAIDDAIRAMVHKAFTTEDEPMVKACQDNMRGRDFFDLDPVILSVDGSAVKARRILQTVIENENKASDQRG